MIRRRTSNLYTAIETRTPDETGVYVGITDEPARRARVHAKVGRTVIHFQEVDDASPIEKRGIHFYQVQEEDGEEFVVTNVQDRITRKELAKRFPENHEPALPGRWPRSSWIENWRS